MYSIHTTYFSKHLLCFVANLVTVVYVTEEYCFVSLYELLSYNLHSYSHRGGKNALEISHSGEGCMAFTL